MTSALNTHEYTAPKNNPEIAAIMAEKGVGRKRAYTILRTRNAAQFNVEVPQTQRAQVLTSLVEHAGSSKNAMVLLETLHGDGVRIDMHDVVKTLWSLQKNRFVSFRERNNPPSLYAIKVTDQGLAAYEGMKERLATDAGSIAPDAPPFVQDRIPAGLLAEAQASVALDHDPRMETQSVEVTDILPGTPEWDESEIALEAQRRAEVYNVPIVDFNQFPLIRSIRDRARKESVLAQAAKLLEEAGEDDIALTVMGRTEYTDLELEVKTMLASIGEV